VAVEDETGRVNAAAFVGEDDFGSRLFCFFAEAIRCGDCGRCDGGGSAEKIAAGWLSHCLPI
jgi:hypothetical protein